MFDCYPVLQDLNKTGKQDHDGAVSLTTTGHHRCRTELFVRVMGPSTYAHPLASKA